jgi:hypothetical protein
VEGWEGYIFDLGYRSEDCRFPKLLPPLG